MSSIVRIVLPALAAASVAYAQCSDSATKTIQNQGDATGLARCSTFTGSIALATGTSEDISLDGIQLLKGNLIANNVSAIKRFGSSSLQKIEGAFELNGAVELVTLNFPALNETESIKFQALPKLGELGFTQEITKADIIDIQNTALRSLKGINVETADEIFIANNPNIDSISMQLESVTKALTFADNKRSVEVSLPQLTEAGNLTFRFCGKLNISNLEELKGSLGLYNNLVESFEAPKLETVGTALAFVANEQMQNISFPKLTEVKGNLQIANNTELEEINGFPELKKVGSSLDLSGNMTKVETPKLENVTGAFNLQSTGDIASTCTDFYKPLKDSKKIGGKFVCEGKLIDPKTEGGKGKSQGGSSNKEGAATVLAQNGALALAALAAVFLL